MSHNHHAHAAHYSDCANPTTCRCETRRYARVLAIAAVILAFEIIGGLLSGSLALLADAGHVFTDMSAIFVSIIVAEIARADFNEHRARNVGFLINVTLLVFVAIMIFFEACERMHEPQEVTSWIMLSVAALGGLGNWMQHKALGGHSHNKTGRVLSLHVLSDLATSVGVVVAGILILLTNAYWIDTAVSFVIAIWILIQVFRLILNPDGDHGHRH